MDTIFALASARGKAGVSVFRVSGSRAFDVARVMTGQPLQPRTPSLRRISDPAGQHLDTGLLIGFLAGHSFTGEDVVEFQVHGSAAVTSALLRALAEVPGLRAAEAGEFTRRALENGRLDLTQVEGLADLIDAETEMQRRQALSVAEGHLRSISEGWRTKLVRALALIEAVIDFADEDVPVDVAPEVLALVDAILMEMQRELAGAKAAERVREGFEVAIVGRPNIGKSTLLNALARREAAITSEVAGTTRDIIEVRMDIDGLPVTLLDTAGLRETQDHVERIGVERARQRAEAADLRVFLVEEGEAPALEVGEDDLALIAKGDLYEGDRPSVSGATGKGIADLVAAIASRLSARASLSSSATRERHRLSISDAAAYIEAARGELVMGESRVEYASENLHQAVRSMDLLLGRVDVEHVLDEIFSSFCIGK